MPGNEGGGRNYPSGIPNPEKVGFISLSSLSGSGIDQADFIRRAGELLGRPVAYTDEQGYEHEIVGASIADNGRRVAWVEGRSKELDKGVMDVTFHLRALVAGKDAIRWEVATYNPYFGCDVGYIGWWGDQVILVYREKHRTLVAAAPLAGSVNLFPIDDEWSLAENTIYYKSREPDLLETVFIPELVRGLPFGADALSRLSAPLRLPLPEDAAKFQGDLHKALFDGSGLKLEKDLILGALGYRFWHQWPTAVESYSETGTLGPWNSPCWLPFYWHTALPEQEGKAFLHLLDQVGEMKTPEDLTPVSLAAAYIIKRCSALAAVCRKGSLPERTHCAFWVGWSEKAFAKDLSLFPEGVGRAFKHLRQYKARW
jgi:hypothetical protein